MSKILKLAKNLNFDFEPCLSTQWNHVVFFFMAEWVQVQSREPQGWKSATKLNTLKYGGQKLCIPPL